MRVLYKAALTPVVLIASTATSLAQAAVAEAVFKCADDKSINAVFYPEKVDLTLSDGRKLELPQTMSGSGARYATADESLVFWNKGNTAFITEGKDETQTYSDCVAEPQSGDSGTK